MKTATYFKLGSVAFAVAVGATLFNLNAKVNAPQAAVLAQTTPPVEQITIDGLLEGTNRLRPTPLTLDPELNVSASAKCADMAAKNYWAHDAPDGTEPWVFFPAHRKAGENLAYKYKTSSEVLSGWRISPTHYANIIRTEFSRVGFAICDFRNTKLVVQHFRD